MKVLILEREECNLVQSLYLSTQFISLPFSEGIIVQIEGNEKKWTQSLDLGVIY